MISDKDLWDFANDLLDAWNIEDANEPSLIEDFRDRFVARFQSAPPPADAFAPEVEERIQEYLRPANGNPQRALRLAVLDLMKMHRGPKACGICGRSYPHAHPTEPACQHRPHYEVVVKGCDCSGCWGEVSTCTHQPTDLWCEHHESPGSCPVYGCAHHSSEPVS